MSTSPRTYRVFALAFVTLLSATSFAGVVQASGGSLAAAIASPANGATFTRISSVHFTDGTIGTSGCVPTSWLWDLGDGASSAAQNPTHAYASLGTFTVTLMASAPGCGFSNATTSVRIDNIRPTASLVVSPSSPHAGDAVTLDASASFDRDGSIASYRFLVNGAMMANGASATTVVAPTLAGAYNATLEARDNNGGLSVVWQLFTVQPDALATITLTGPSTIVAGSTESYALAGADAYGNAVTLAQSALDYTAPSAVGSATVSYAEQGVTGSLPVDVVAAPLASITLDGPSLVMAGTSTDYALSGADAYGNAVPLAQATTTFVAPTQVGGAEVSYTESGVTGTAFVFVTHADLATIHVSGLDYVAAGETVSYNLYGEDQYGNGFDLATPSIEFSSTVAGPAQACYTESGVTGCKDLTVTPASSVGGVVTGPDSLVAGTSGDYHVRCLDAYGNLVWESDYAQYAGSAAGPLDVTFLCDGITGVTATKTIMVLADALAFIEISGPDSLHAGEAGLFALAGTDQFGNPVALAQSTLSYTAPETTGNAVVSYTEGAVTGSKDVNVVPSSLGRIDVSGPDSLVVDATGGFHADGFDGYGNPVTLESPDFTATAPTSAGSFAVCFTQGELSGCKMVDALPGATASVLITGPNSLVAGKSGDFTASAFDQFNNAVASENFAYTAGTHVGGEGVVWTIDGVQGGKTIEVTHDALASIFFMGDDALRAGEQTSFIVLGGDQYGNLIILDAFFLDYTAPTTVGPATVTYSQDGVTGTKDVMVYAGPLATITLTGPASIAAGSATDYAAAGADPYGNEVSLASPVVTYHAPTTAGPAEVSTTEAGVTGTLPVEIVAAQLARIDLSGPDRFVVGTSGSFGLAGFDAFGNPVGLSQARLDYTAPQEPGSYVASYTESGVTGEKTIDVVPQGPSYIEVTGPATLVAGETATYAATGYDVYNNEVPLAQPSFGYTAPTLVGAVQVCHAEQGTEGCLDVTVVHDVLARITVDGPDALVVGESATYALAGYDQYGNPVALAQSTLDYTAPQTAGPATVAYAENGVAGTHAITVIPVPVASVTVTAERAQTNALRTVAFHAKAFDANGQEITGAAFTWTTSAGKVSSAGVLTAPSTAGNVTVTATAGGASGSAVVAVTTALHATLKTSRFTYNATDAQTGTNAKGTAAFTYADGTPAPNVSVTVVLSRADAGVASPGATVSGKTNAAGVFVFDLPKESSVPGKYSASATGTDGANRGTATTTYYVAILAGVAGVP